MLLFNPLRYSINDDVGEDTECCLIECACREEKKHDELKYCSWRWYAIENGGMWGRGMVS